MGLLLQFVLLVAGFVMLVKGADWFVDGAAGFAEKFGIPHLVVGLTIVAMGTSAPEAAVSINAALKGSAGITIGNVVGSNIMNILLILGITAVICALQVKASTVKIEIPFLILVSLVLLVFGVTGNQITFIEGIGLAVLFVIYLTYLFFSAKNNREEVNDDMKNEPVWKLLLTAVVGLVLVVVGSDVTVNAAEKIALAAGMSERLVGLTIIAFGTSLPELVTSSSAALKGKADIAIGNIVGSNIFNILFVVGITALITPVAFEPLFRLDGIIAALAAVLLLLCTFPKKKLSRIGGAVLLAGYIGYFVHIMI